MEDDLVTVASYSLFTDADMARIDLEAEGISCRLENENTVVANIAYANAVGGIRIRVRREDEQRARAIVERSARVSEKPSFCPECDAGDIELIETRLLFGLLRGHPKRRCRRCGYTRERVGL